MFGVSDVQTLGLFTLATCLATLLGAFISGILSKHGISFFFKNKVRIIKCIGTAKDIDASPLSSNFYGKIFTYELGNVVIKIASDCIELTADIISKYNDSNKTKQGRLKGKGDISGEFAFVIYTGTYPNTGENWKGTMVLQVPNMGTISGFWMSQHHLKEGGPYAMGEIEFHK